MSFVATLPDGPAPERRKRRRLKNLAFLPTLITLGNLTCGFAAIHFGLRAMYEMGNNRPIEQLKMLQQIELLLPSFLSVGAGLIILGMVFDCFDGLIARVTRSTTDFGGQLDSLADVVTCGVAPATLMVAFMIQHRQETAIVPSPISEHALGRIAWIAAAVYVAFTAIRLARYNVEHARADFDYRTFRGLPSPGAAGVMASLIILQDYFSDFSRMIVLYALPFVALGLAFLMVSRIPYRRFHRAYLLGKQPFGHLMIFAAIFVVFMAWSAPTMLVLVVWYALSGPVEMLLRRIRGKSVTIMPSAIVKPPPGERRTA